MSCLMLKSAKRASLVALEGTVAFTGRLASMRRADAFALVRTHGGKPREGVTKRTDVLIVGEFGWLLKGGGRFTGMPRMTLRLRYRVWKLRALCWVLRRLRAGQRGGWLARPN
jgi:hypothetical protein